MRVMERAAHDWWQAFDPVTWSNWSLVLVGVAGVIAALFTLNKIKKQAETMERQTGVLQESVAVSRIAADTAKANTDALINSERAWIIPELRPHSYRDKDRRWRRQNGDYLSPEEILAGKHLFHSLRLTNMGRTPAQILGFEMRYACLPENVRDLPVNAGGEFAETREANLFLGGGDVYEIEEPILDVESCMTNSLRAIENLEKTAVFFGWVKYRHMFSTTDDCYADFCYCYTVSSHCLSSVSSHTKQRQQRAN